MKSSLLPLLVIATTLGLLPNTRAAQDKPDLADHNQKINYAFGQDIVSTFKQQDVEIDLKAFIAGMKDALADRPLLSAEEKQTALKELSDEFMANAAAARKVAAVKNAQEAETFLAGNAKKPGVRLMDVTAPDGSQVQLQYEILKTGAGPSPQKTDSVEVHYTGALIDGSVFDSSVKRGSPVTFSMGHIMPGWGAALAKMKVGDQWRLYVPPKLGFGDFGPPQIGPDCALIYELELLSFFPTGK